MPVKKYKTFEEARRDLWILNPDDKYLQRLRNLFIASEKLSNRKISRGIKKYKTIEEANRV